MCHLEIISYVYESADDDVRKVIVAEVLKHCCWSTKPAIKMTVLYKKRPFKILRERERERERETHTHTHTHRDRDRKRDYKTGKGIYSK